ncbi:MAG: RluA family pseudouridine synthase [Prevotellaceae bacterium]|jgi:23S rRNA pseudouridine1911/1915/1917 synthase|nr:RluA family pseudouridine synthase [Prevotellaceae bacterium]
MASLNILYEDNHIIAVNKVGGELVQADKECSRSLEEDVKLFIKVRDKKPSLAFVGVVHRLDRPVSGVVIFAKTSKALSRLNAMFRLGQVHKTYHAIVKKRPPQDEDLLTHYLIRNEKQNKSYAHSSAKPNAKESRLRYRLVAASKSFFLVEVELLTGRHHQIRCQLSKTGCPIKGDLKYGYARSNPNGSISLHARSISFTHPVSKMEINIVAPYPSGDVWENFTPNR